jgi:hypothetical protein
MTPPGVERSFDLARVGVGSLTVQTLTLHVLADFIHVKSEP